MWHSFINVLFISTGIFDDKLCPQNFVGRHYRKFPFKKKLSLFLFISKIKINSLHSYLWQFYFHIEFCNAYRLVWNETCIHRPPLFHFNTCTGTCKCNWHAWFKYEYCSSFRAQDQFMCVDVHSQKLRWVTCIYDICGFFSALLYIFILRIV